MGGNISQFYRNLVGIAQNLFENLIKISRKFCYIFSEILQVLEH